jgi:hypothetical protein
MREKTTFEQLRSKLSTISETYGMALAPYDIDKFLALGPYSFYDANLDGPPTVDSVETLVKLGVPRWPLTNKEPSPKCLTYWRRGVQKDWPPYPRPGSFATRDTLGRVCKSSM